MKTCCSAKSIFALVLIAALSLGSVARAEEDSEPGLAPGSESMDQVLEIPQQCDKDAVAVLCDRGETGADSADQQAQQQDQSPAAAPGPGEVVGSLDDYQNQQETIDPTAVYYVPVPVYVPVYPIYRTMPAPGGVPSVPSGTHFLRPLPMPHRPGAFGGRFGRTR